MTIDFSKYRVFGTRINILPVLMIVFAFTSSAHAALTVTADRDVIYEDESVQLVVRYDGQATTGEPDFSSLKKNFDILNTNRQQQYTWSNGKAESYTDWNLTLLPRRAGMLLIPPLNYGGQVSDAIVLEVRKVSQSSTIQNAQQAIFSETKLDKETVYVQEQVLVTRRLYTSVSLTDYSLTPLSVDNALVEQVSENQFQKKINGRDYLVIELRYAIFPQGSGELVVPSQRFGAFEAPVRRQFGVFNQRGKQVIRKTGENNVRVLDHPSHIPGNEWLPSSRVEITETWNGDLGKLRVGEPITRSITMTADGLTGAQIHPLVFEPSADYRVYPDQAQIETRKTDSGVIGVRIESMAIVPKQAGEIDLPPIEIVWWNTDTKMVDRTRVESQTLEIGAGSPLQSQTNSVYEPDAKISISALEDSALEYENKKPSQTLAISLGVNAILFCLVIALLMWRSSPKTSNAISKSAEPDSKRLSLKQHLKVIQRYSKASNLVDSRNAILHWGHLFFSESPPRTLEALGIRLGDPTLDEEFSNLDRQLYESETTAAVDFEAIMDRLKKYTLEPKQTDHAGEIKLKPLYPTDNLRESI